MLSFQWSVIVNLLLRVSQGVKNSQRKACATHSNKGWKMSQEHETFWPSPRSRLKKHLTVNHKFVQMKYKNEPGPVFNSETKFRKHLAWNILWKGLANYFPSPPSSHEINYHLHPGFWFYYLLPPSLLQQNFAQATERQHSIQMGLHTCQHFSALIL